MPYLDLPPRETKILTAKALVWRALANHERELIGRNEELRQSFHEAVSSIRAWPTLGEKEIMLPEFLSSFLSHMRASLAKFFKPDDQYLLERFLGHLEELIKTGRCLLDESHLWKQRLEVLAQPYLADCCAGVSVPSVRLLFDTLKDSSPLEIEGKFDSDELGHRRIHILFNVNRFASGGYFSIPSVLSHEFWCHCLTNLGSAPDQGIKASGNCEPWHPFEEGWMDHVQHRLLEMHIHSMVDEEYLSMFRLHGEAHKNYRVQSSRNRFLGAVAAMDFEHFLERHLPDQPSLFLRISISLNASHHPLSLKEKFVDRVAELLHSGMGFDCVSSSVAERNDEKLIANHEALLRAVQESISGEDFQWSVLFNVLNIR